MDRIKIKSMAKEQIKGNIGILFVCALIIAVISGLASWVLSFIRVAGPILNTVLIAPAFTLSMVNIYINLSNGQKPEAGDVFTGFYDFWSAFKVSFMVGLFTFLWSLLFVIPGIIKAYSYSMSMYILSENKGMGALDCISKSKEIMDGKKMDLFVLELSFIGWALLSIITFGIAFIWVGPYMNATFVNFYNEIKGGQSPFIKEVPYTPTND